MREKVDCKYFKFIRKHNNKACTRIEYRENGHWGKCRLCTGHFRGCNYFEPKEPFLIRLIDKILNL